MAMNDAPIGWRSCRQRDVTLWSAGAKYVVASAAAQATVYLRLLTLYRWVLFSVAKQCRVHFYD
jgi:hypothetical protein